MRRSDGKYAGSAHSSELGVELWLGGEGRLGGQGEIVRITVDPCWSRIVTVVERGGVGGVTWGFAILVVGVVVELVWEVIGVVVGSVAVLVVGVVGVEASWSSLSVGLVVLLLSLGQMRFRNLPNLSHIGRGLLLLFLSLSVSFSRFSVESVGGVAGVVVEIDCSCHSK